MAAIVYNNHKLENEILEIFGLSGRDVRKLEFCFEVNELVTVQCEFFPTQDEINNIIKTIKGKYRFEVKEQVK